MNHELNIELEIEKEEEKKRLPLPPAFPQCTSDCCCLGFRSSSQYRCFLWFSSWPHKGGSAECKGVLQCGGAVAQSALHPRRGRLAMMTIIIRRLWWRTRGGGNGLWSFLAVLKLHLRLPWQRSWTLSILFENQLRWGKWFVHKIGFYSGVRGLQWSPRSP